MREIRLSGSKWRGPETERWQTYTGTKLETADTAKGSLDATAPVPDPTLERRAGDAEEQGELVPAFEQVAERVAESGVGLDAALVELGSHPCVERGHDRCALGSMEREALVGGHGLLRAERLVLEHLGETVEDVTTFGRKVSRPRPRHGGDRARCSCSR